MGLHDELVKEVMTSQGGVLRGQFFGIGLTYGENLLRLVYGVTVLLFARKLLTAEMFSVFAFYLTLAVLLYGFSKFSLDAYAVRALVRHPEDGRPLVLRLVLFRLTCSFFFLLLFLSGLTLAKKLQPEFIPLLAFQLLRPADSVEWLLRATDRIALQATARIFSMLTVLTALVVVYLLDLQLTPLQLLIILAAEWSFLALFYFSWFMKQYRQMAPRVGDTSSLLRVVVQSSVPAYMAYVLFLVYSKLDQLVLEGVINSVAYGNYMIAARLNESAVIVIVSLNMVVYPRLVKLHLDSNSKFSAAVHRTSMLFLLLAICVISSVWGMRTLYPLLPTAIQGFLPFQVLEYLSWMVFSTLPVFFFGLRSSYFTIIDKPRHIIWGGVLGFATMLFIGIPLMMNWGGYGGGAALIISAFSALFISNFINCDGRFYLRIVFMGDPQ